MRRSRSTAVATTSLPDRRGLAAGVRNTSTQLGNAVGLAVAATIVGLAAGADTQRAGALALGLGASVVFAILARAVVSVGLHRDPAR